MLTGRFREFFTELGLEADLAEAFNAVRKSVVDRCANGFQFYSYGSYDDSPELKARQEQIIASEVERYFRKAKDMSKDIENNGITNN